MSKYTTELRTICEYKAGLTESKGGNDVDTVLAQSWDKVFTTRVQFFDESYRRVLCKKILKHYYTQEIAYETVGLFLLKVNTKLEEVMPYYNKVYTAVAKDYNMLWDTDYTVEGNKDGSRKGKYEDGGSRESTRTDLLKDSRTVSDITKETDQYDETTTNDLKQESNGTTEASSNGTASNTHSDNYQETPQGSLVMVEEMNYLTNARRVSDNSTNQVSDTGSSSNTVTNTGDVTLEHDQTRNITRNGHDTVDHTGTQKNQEEYGSLKKEDVDTTEGYVEHITGKKGGMTYSQMVDDYISRLKNVDMLVIGEFRKEFMQLW